MTKTPTKENPMKSAKTIRLTSSEFVSAPGMLAWAINGYRFPRDRQNILNVMKSWDGLTDAEWHDILTEKTPHKIVDNSVEITLQR